MAKSRASGYVGVLGGLEFKGDTLLPGSRLRGFRTEVCSFRLKNCWLSAKWPS